MDALLKITNSVDCRIQKVNCTLCVDICPLIRYDCSQVVFYCALVFISVEEALQILCQCRELLEVEGSFVLEDHLQLCIKQFLG